MSAIAIRRTDLPAIPAPTQKSILCRCRARFGRFLHRIVMAAPDTAPEFLHYPFP